MVFSLPFWLQTWWEHLGGGTTPLLLSVWADHRLLGLAPLMIQDNDLRLLGSPDVCDYLDFITVPGCERYFFEALLPALAEKKLAGINFFSQHPAAIIFKGFFSGEPLKPWRGSFKRENETAELILPTSWEAYLALLSKKQRHEVRRKIRKLEHETKCFCFKQLEEINEIVAFLPHFFSLFLQNQEKTHFFNPEIKDFFHNLVLAAAKAGMARFGVLEVDGYAVAAVLYFDYLERVYLYNSGYDPDYAPLSVGLLSKIFSIRKSIDSGKRVFDFLKGPEIYKHRLGGKTVPIYEVTLFNQDQLGG